MQGPLGEDFTRITTRSSQRDLYKIMQGPLRDLLERFSLGSPQDLLLEEPVRDHGRTSQRGLYQDVLYTFSRGLCLKMWGIRYTLSMAIYHIVWMCCLSVGEPGVWREHLWNGKSLGNLDVIPQLTMVFVGWLQHFQHWMRECHTQPKETCRIFFAEHRRLRMNLVAFHLGGTVRAVRPQSLTGDCCPRTCTRSCKDLLESQKGCHQDLGC